MHQFCLEWSHGRIEKFPWSEAKNFQVYWNCENDFINLGILNFNFRQVALSWICENPLIQYNITKQANINVHWNYEESYVLLKAVLLLSWSELCCHDSNPKEQHDNTMNRKVIHVVYYGNPHAMTCVAASNGMHTRTQQLTELRRRKHPQQPLVTLITTIRMGGEGWESK